MSWIEKIQNKPQAQKMKIIWTAVVVIVILLIITWVISARLSKKTPKDTTLFQTINRGLKDFKNNFKK